MRSYLLIFVALATVLLCTKYINAEKCIQENCVAPYKCEEPIKSQDVTCDKQDTTCCSIVKEEYRTFCRHHGGECMNDCAANLQRNETECPSNQVCCVLV